MAERKRFIDVKVPIFGETLRVLGTTKDLHNKTIKLDMTRKLRGKGLTVTLRILNNEGTLYALPDKMELVKSYIRRATRKRTDYVEDSFNAQCKDIRTTIKPFLVTRKRVSRAVRKNLRNTTKEFLLDYLKTRDFDHICNELLDGTLQKTLLPKLKKVYPLAFCDIRIFQTKEIEKADLNKIIKESSKINEEETDIQEIPEEKSEKNEDSPKEKEEETKE